MLELAKLIKKYSYLEGDFVLRSGKHSKYYLDKYLFETKHEVLDLLTDAFVEKINSQYKKFDIIAAPELGAVSIVAALSIKLKKDFVIVRKDTKEYGTSKSIEGSIEDVKTAIIVEDILTTGGAAIKSAHVLKNQDINVLAIVGTIDRLQGAKFNIEKEGFKHDTLLTIKDLEIKS